VNARTRQSRQILMPSRRPGGDNLELVASSFTAQSARVFTVRNDLIAVGYLR